MNRLESGDIFTLKGSKQTKSGKDSLYIMLFTEKHNDTETMWFCPVQKESSNIVLSSLNAPTHATVSKTKTDMNKKITKTGFNIGKKRLEMIALYLELMAMEDQDYLCEFVSDNLYKEIEKKSKKKKELKKAPTSIFTKQTKNRQYTKLN